jgi:predicted DNA binding protein
MVSGLTPGPIATPRVIDSTSRLVTCRLKISLPPESSWLYALTTRHPGLRAEVLDRLQLAEGKMLTEVRLHGPHRPEWGAEIEELPGVEQVELLEDRDSTALCRVTHRIPPYVAALQELRVLRRLPFWVENGVATWIVVVAEDRLRPFLDSLTPKVSAVHLDSILRGPSSPLGTLLTARQSELFQRAVGEGYFDVPRKVSLTELARRVNVSKSTLSQSLAIVEKKLVVQAARDGSV